MARHFPHDVKFPATLGYKHMCMLLWVVFSACGRIRTTFPCWLMASWKRVGCSCHHHQKSALLGWLFYPSWNRSYLVTSYRQQCGRLPSTDLTCDYITMQYNPSQALNFRMRLWNFTSLGLVLQLPCVKCPAFQLVFYKLLYTRFSGKYQYIIGIFVQAQFQAFQAQFQAFQAGNQVFRAKNKVFQAENPSFSSS